MLPLWHDEIFITIYPTTIGLLKVGNRLGRLKILGRHTQAIPAEGGEKSKFAYVAKALESSLKSPEWYNAQVRVGISNALLRYMTLPWEDIQLSEDESTLLAKHRVEEAFGTASKSWEISLSEQHYQQPRLLCAVERELLESIKKVTATNKLQLVSIEPQLVSVLNFWKWELKPAQFYMLHLDEDKVNVAYVKGGFIQSIRTEAMDKQRVAAQVSEMIQRETLISGQVGERIAAFAFASTKGLSQFTVDSSKNINLQWLKAPSTLSNPKAFFLATYH